MSTYKSAPLAVNSTGYNKSAPRDVRKTFNFIYNLLRERKIRTFSPVPLKNLCWLWKSLLSAPLMINEEQQTQYPPLCLSDYKQKSRIRWGHRRRLVPHLACSLGLALQDSFVPSASTGAGNLQVSVVSEHNTQFAFCRLSDHLLLQNRTIRSSLLRGAFEHKYTCLYSNLTQVRESSEYFSVFQNSSSPSSSSSKGHLWWQMRRVDKNLWVSNAVIGRLQHRKERS